LEKLILLEKRIRKLKMYPLPVSSQLLLTEMMPPRFDHLRLKWIQQRRRCYLHFESQ
jgi:hypothetical protein